VTIRFVLASASPARYETLVRAGVRPEVIVSGVDEDAVRERDPRRLVQTLADRKADAVASALVGRALVLGCDSMLDLDGVALGKPGQVDVTIARWQQMRGRSGMLHTGHCLVERGGSVVRRTVSTGVRFADVSDDEIELYVSTGEPSNVAGGFTIDGWGGWFVEGVDGDPHNVVGLSLPVLRTMLAELGFGLRDLGYPAD
jgi:septum formation protein